MALNGRQERFAYEYVIDFNATQAAKRAGYSEVSAHSIGSLLLQNAEIAELIGKLQLGETDKLTATRERVVDEMAKLAFSDVSKLFDDDGSLIPVHQLDHITKAALASCEVVQMDDKAFVRKLKFHNKLGALDKLATHFNLYSEHEKNKSVTININGKDADL